MHDIVYKVIMLFTFTLMGIGLVATVWHCGRDIFGKK